MTDEISDITRAMEVEAIWDRFLTPQDKEVHAASGAGRRMGFGSRPALIVVDVSYGFTGAYPAKAVDSVKKWQLSCGEYGWAAVPRIREIIHACRAKRVPVIYSTGESGTHSPSPGVRRKKKESTAFSPDHNRILEEIAPAPEEIVIRKLMPSAFLGTPLLGHLIDLNRDSLLVTGAVTSNCVRATVVDAVSHNFRCTVLADACFDRIEASHAINLFDMNAKYADVVLTQEAIRYVESHP